MAEPQLHLRGIAGVLGGTSVERQRGVLVTACLDVARKLEHALLLRAERRLAVNLRCDASCQQQAGQDDGSKSRRLVSHALGPSAAADARAGISTQRLNFRLSWLLVGSAVAWSGAGGATDQSCRCGVR